MQPDDTIGRRQFMEMSAGGLLLLGCSGVQTRGGAREGVGYFDRFGVSEKLLAETLSMALSRGGDFADTFLEDYVSHHVGAGNETVHNTYSTKSLGAGVRVVSGERTGYAFAADLTRESLLECARSAAAVADGPGRDTPIRFHVGGPLPQRYPMRVRWEDVRPSDRVRLALEANKRALDDGRVTDVQVSLRDEVCVVLIADSRGRIVEDIRPLTTLEVTCTVEQGGRRKSATYSAAARAGLEFHTDELRAHVIAEAKTRALTRCYAVPAPAGEMPVVLGAGSSGQLLHEAIGHAMEADLNRKNISTYSDSIGTRVAKPFVNIVDDATLENAAGAINVDDEGNAAGRTHLVQDGVLATYLHDAISARHYGVEPTGNGRRQGFAFAPLPRMRATYMLPGPHSKDEIIASVKKGIYCVDLSSSEVNVATGKVAFHAGNGFLIEEGRLTRAIRDVNIVGNGPEMLQRIDMVAADLKMDDRESFCGKAGQLVPVSVGSPTLRVSSLTLRGGGESA